MDLQRVWNFFNENDWLKLFHKLTTDEIEKLRGQNNMQFTVQGRIYNKGCIPTKTPIKSLKYNLSYPLPWIWVKHAKNGQK